MHFLSRLCAAGPAAGAQRGREGHPSGAFTPAERREPRYAFLAAFAAWSFLAIREIVRPAVFL